MKEKGTNGVNEYKEEGSVENTCENRYM